VSRRRKDVGSSEIRAIVAGQAQTIRELLTEAAARRDEEARRKADLMRQRDKAARQHDDV